jgi:hypothetical protein
LNPIELINPLFYPIIGIPLAVAAVAGKASASTRRILAVLTGGFAGYGLGVAVNAVLTSIMSWHSLPSGASLFDGDIMTGLMIAGGGAGLLASLFIRETASNLSKQAPSETGALIRHDEPARR